MKSKKQNKTWLMPIFTFVVMLLIFVVLFGQLTYLSLSPTIYGKNMDEFAANRNTVKKTIKASRGNIYDSAGDILALNVSSYTVIANLEKSKVYMKDNYVKDINATAEALAPILNMEKDALVNIMNSDKYQVELGPGGRGITELVKEQIEELNLSGITFTEKQKRYYPNGDFASYIIGYAKEKEVTIYDENDNEETLTEIVGELGVESKYNDLLKGTDGYLEYQQDKYGYKISGTKQINIKAQDGYDVYLTVDSTIQRFVETEIKKSQEEYNPEWITISIMDATNGDILATSSTPSFDPNLRNLTNYENIFTSIPFEPGSTMKTYTYICSLENGKYNGDDTYYSGSYQVGEYTVNDWNNTGWGEITFDKGYEYSSNVGIANLINRTLDKNKLKECFEKYGFGSTTGIELSRESSGSIDFNYEIELITAGFGQGITTTPVQQLQALTLLSNNGKMLKPHIIEKIINPNTKEVYFERKKEETEKIISDSTVSKMKQLMYNTVHGKDPGTTGYMYNVEGLNVIGKTGTSQIYNNETGTYSYGDNEYIFSFAGMFPYENPKIIVYAAMKKPTWGKSAGLYKAVQDVMQSIGNYLGMYSKIEEAQQSSLYEIKNYVNKEVESSKQELESKGINVKVIGNGNKVIKQSIKSGNHAIIGDKMILLTNSSQYLMPNIISWSKKEAITLFEMLNIKYKVDGFGYVISQSIPEGTIINDETEILIALNNNKLEGEQIDEEEIKTNEDN